MSVRVEPHTFEPAIYSNQELQFLLDHLEEPTTAALHDALPPGVNPIAIERCLDELQKLEQLKQFKGIEWAGFDAVKDSIERYLDWDVKRKEIFRITGGPNGGPGAIANASMYAYDEDGSAFKFAIGADSAEMPRTEILDDGTRRAFGVKLLQPDGEAMVNALGQVAPWMKRGVGTAVAKTKDEVKTDKHGTHGSLQCSICGKAEEFDARVRSSYLTARSRMAKHLKSAKSDVNRHRLLYRKVFESRTSKV